MKLPNPKRPVHIERRDGRVIVRQDEDKIDYFNEDPPTLLIVIGMLGIGLLLGLSLYEAYAIYAGNVWK